jgi:hypothetical protein
MRCTDEYLLAARRALAPTAPWRAASAFRKALFGLAAQIERMRIMILVTRHSKQH